VKVELHAGLAFVVSVVVVRTGAVLGSGVV